jgi:hypothetical protein
MSTPIFTVEAADAPAAVNAVAAQHSAANSNDDLFTISSRGILIVVF